MKKLINLRNKKKGFTLIELIVVIAILGILAAILVPSMMSFIGDARASAVKANCQSIVTGTSAWASHDIAGSTAFTGGTYGTDVGDVAPPAELLTYISPSPTGVVWSVTVTATGAVTAASYTEGGKTCSFSNGVYTNS